MPAASDPIVILGCGFAGVNAARRLERTLPRDRAIILFSQENQLVFTPLLGNVVGSSINPMHVVWPVRQMVRRVACRTAAVTAIDLAARQVHYRTPANRPASQAFSQKLYEAAARDTNAAGSSASGASSGQGAGPVDDDDIVDAEIVDEG